jgi:phenolic acid decarboxylase
MPRGQSNRFPEEDSLMADDRSADRIVGKTLRFNWDDGPTKGMSHEHVFNADGSVDYRKVDDGAAMGKTTHEKKFGSVRVTDDVYVASYLAASGFTLTVVLNFADGTIAGFASNDKQWFPVKGTFETVE